MTNIIYFTGNRQVRLDEEIAKIDSARPITKLGACQLFTTMIQFFESEGQHEWDLADLFYGGCIFLAMLFVKMPEHPLHPKISHQVMLPLLEVAEEAQKFEQSFWEQTLALAPVSKSVSCNEQHVIGLQRRFVETAEIFKQVGIGPSIFFRQSKDAETIATFFKSIEFVLRRKFSQLMEEQFIALRHILQRDPEIFLLVDNISRLGMVAGITARFSNKDPSEFIAIGKLKFLQITADALGKNK